MKLIALRGGDVVMDLGRVSGGGPGRKVVCPIMSFLVVTENDRVLFDTGMNPIVRTDAVGHWGRVANRMIVPIVPLGGNLLELLTDVGYPPETVTVVANSHLHNDHAGTNLHYPNARVLVRPAEWEHATTLMDKPSSGYVRGDFYDENQPPEFIEYDATYDVLGDGTVELISTIGHTPGHQSLRVRFPSGRTFVMTGDAAYSESDLEGELAPAIAWKPEMAGAANGYLRSLRAEGQTVLVCHDEPTWQHVKDYALVHEEA